MYLLVANLIKINPCCRIKKSISKENTKLNRESEIVKIPGRGNTN